MADDRSRWLFVNLAVSDLPRSKRFFEGLGFRFDPRFTDDSAACMVIGPQCCAMLLTEPRFRDFTRKRICDTRSATEGLFAFSAESREEVDRIAEKALATGATPAMEPADHGFMYVRSFYDPDGHHWEVMWMDPAAVPPA